MEYTLYRAMGAVIQFDGAVEWNNTQYVFMSIVEGGEFKYECISELIDGKPFPVSNADSSEVSKLIRRNIQELEHEFEIAV